MRRLLLSFVASLAAVPSYAGTLLDQRVDLTLDGSEWVYMVGGAGCPYIPGRPDCRALLSTIASFANSGTQKNLNIVPLSWFGTKGDGVIYHACVISAGSKTPSCSESFLASAVGKSVVFRGAGASGGTLRTTIDSVSLLGDAHLAKAAASTTTGAYWQQMLWGTDDTAAVVSAVASLTSGQTLSVPSGVTGKYLVGGRLSLDNKKSVAIEGQGYNRILYDDNGPQFIYTGGAGSGTFISTSAAQGIKIDSLGLSYFDDTYDGLFITIGAPSGIASQITISNSRIGGLMGTLKGTTGVGTGQGSQPGNAQALVYIQGAYGVDLINDLFANAHVAVLGPSAAVSGSAVSYIYANSIRATGNTYYGGFLKNPEQVAGQSWVSKEEIFEPYNNMYNGSGHLLCGGIGVVDPTGSGAPTVAVSGLAILGDTFEDAASQESSGSICVDTDTPGDVRGLTVTGGNTFAFGGTGVRVNSVGTTHGATVTGNVFESLMNGYTFSTGPGAVTDFFAAGNSFSSVYNAAAGSLASGNSFWETTSSYIVNGLGYSGIFHNYGVYQDVNTAARGTCDASNRGQIKVERDVYSIPDYSDRLSVCLKANGNYQWIDATQNGYVPSLFHDAHTSSITPTSLQFGGGVLARGTYRISYYASVSSSATGTVTLNFAWTDNTSYPYTANSAALNTAAAGYIQGSIIITTDGIANATYGSTATGTGQVTLNLSVERLY